MSRTRRRAALAPCLAVLWAAVLAGCGTAPRGTGGGGVAGGDTLTVHVSVPRATAAGRDLLDGAKLALADQEGRLREFAVNLSAHDASAAAGGIDAQRAVAAARAAIDDPAAVALVDVGDSRAARLTAPLLNAAGILHVSVGAGYAGLTSPRGAVPGEPQRYRPAGDRERTFARLLPSDLDAAPALVRAADGARRIAVEAEGSDAGRALAAALRDRIGPARLTTDTARAGAVIYAGEDPVNALGVLEAAGRENPRARLVGGDALARSGLASRLPRPVRRRLRLVSAAPRVTPAFRERFRRALGRAPGPYAAVGYEAMLLVLDAIVRTGRDAAVRPVLNAAVLASRRRGTLLGDYAFDAHGDTTRRAVTTLRPR